MPLKLIAAFPRPVNGYAAASDSLIRTLAGRLEAEPFNAIATGILMLAISPVGLTLGTVVPTLMAATVFRVL